jgi:hypothetical protein
LGIYRFAIIVENSKVSIENVMKGIQLNLFRAYSGLVSEVKEIHFICQLTNQQHSPFSFWKIFNFALATQTFNNTKTK